MEKPPMKKVEKVNLKKMQVALYRISFSKSSPRFPHFYGITGFYRVLFMCQVAHDTPII
jgi:hypothetical protein